MTDWPRMESKVTISDAYYVSEDFKDLTENSQQEILGLSGLPLKVVSLSIFLGRHLVGVTAGTVDHAVPLEFVEPVEDSKESSDKPGDRVELSKDWFIKASQGNSQAEEDNASEVVSFRFANNIFLDDAILFFARNGYKAWVEEEFGVIYTTQRLMVEKPKEER